MKFRKIISVAALLTLLSIEMVFANGQQESKNKQEEMRHDVEIGPIADKIYINVRMKQEIALKDVAEGLSDVLYTGVDGPVVSSLDKETRDKLELYSTPSGSWSLLMNPIPNKAPYLVDVEGEDLFNPFAIRKVRYALNDLIDRKYIVDEILGGAGGPMLSMATPGQPGTYKYNVLASKMDLSETGNEEKAIRDITEAFNAAAALPELRGKLVNDGKWWTYRGTPISVKFIIRVDDPSGRLKEGHYVSDQLEKVGIQVERLLWDRSKAGNVVYGSDPAEYQWSIYTEGWGAGETRAYWEHIVAQMYAPWYGYMPGGAVPENWNINNPELDDVTEKAFNGNYLDTDEYWELSLRGLELGLEEAVRVYVCYQNQYYATNKEVYNKRTPYGRGDGFNRWSIIGSDTKKEELNVTCYSAKGSLFMNPWDPVGTDGFSDTYSRAIAELASDPIFFENPATAESTDHRTLSSNVRTEVGRNAAGEVVGQIKVPSSALKYNSGTNSWEEVGEGVTAMSTADYEYPASKFHHGERNDLTFPLYVNAFIQEWATKDADTDKYVDEAMVSFLGSGLKTRKGIVFDVENNTYTAYFDYNFPPSEARTASKGMLSNNMADGSHTIHVSWEITEAMGLMVAEGSASGQVYSFTYGAAGAEEPDLLNEKSNEDILAMLRKMKSERHVPDSLAGFVSEEEAVRRYDSAINWIVEKGHSFISDGPYYIEKYDATTNYMELSAYRDSSYPFKSDYWPKVLETATVSIDDLEMPASVSMTEGLTASVYVSEVQYPYDISESANNASVSVKIITETEELEFPGVNAGDGLYTITIPEGRLKGLDIGIYTMIFNAYIKGAVPDVKAGTIKLN